MMEHMFKKFLSLALLVSASAALADDCCDSDCNKSKHAITCFAPRSQSKNNVIKNAGLDPDHQYLYEMDNFYGTFNAALEYSQSFRNERLGKCLFGPAARCDCDDVQIRVKGTQAEPNGTSDLVAENFFLPKDFESTLTFSPSIKNINTHLQFYAGLDEWCNGLWFRLWAPITHTRWDLDVCENANTGAEGFAAGEIATEDVAATALHKNFLSFAQGSSINNLPGDVVVRRLANARFTCDTETETKLADLRAELGWNFSTSEDHHVGLYLEVAAPTGNECEPCLLFGPLVGNGNHWELGGGLSAHYTLWRSEDDAKQFDFYVDADVTHLFKNSEKRTFDLKNKPLSRYMMAQRMTSDIQDGLEAGGTAASAQFAKVFAPLANFTTREVDVKVSAQGEIAAKFVYTCNGFSWDIGYDFFGRSCEDIEFGCECSNFEEKTWALRGDAQVFGFQDGAATAVALGASRNAANAFSLSGGGTTNVFATANVDNNTQVDKPAAATSNTVALRALPSNDDSTINTSDGPTFIKQEDLDLTGTRVISHKIFTHFNYTWIDREDWIPYVGFGASVEFGKSESSDDCCPSDSNTNSNTSCNTSCDTDCNDSCDDCVDCAVSQWAIWLKGGLSFN